MPSADRRRVVSLSRRLIREFQIDLEGLTVLTEAATGIFAVTPTLASLAGARVFAIAKSTSYGSAGRAIAESKKLAESARAADRIGFVSSIASVPLEKVDLVTNSGHVRPIGRSLLRRLPKTAVVSLMVEPWEVRHQDVDLRAAHALGIAAAGVFERGRKVDLFRNLSPLLLKVLRGHRIRIRGRKVQLLCSNPFKPYLDSALKKAGALKARGTADADFIVIATGPFESVPAKTLSPAAKGTPVIQIWGDLLGKRPSHLRFFPKKPPLKGHMAYLLTDLGPEPGIRLIAAGLKVGELLARARENGLSPLRSITHAERSGFALAPNRC